MPPRVPGSALPRRLERHLRESRLLAPGDAVTIALSGGLDSTVLLHLLRFPLRSFDLRLSAAHLDHAMRPGSDHDAAWVRGLCGAWDVPLVSERLPDPPRSEAAARERRYDFLERAAPPGARIVTAHHLDDQAETVLFRATRGTGVRGLRGIAPRRGRIVRPLLPFTRPELEAYAAAVGVVAREDPTNRDLSFARNRTRHRILPALRRVRPDIARTLSALADRARDAEARWRPLVRRAAAAAVLERDDTAVTLARDVLRSYHPEVGARVLRLVLRRFGRLPGRAGTRAALEFIMSGRSGGQLELPGGVRVERDLERIRIARVGDTSAGDVTVEIGSPEPGDAKVRIGGRLLAVRWGPGPLDGPKAGVPADAVFPLSLRGWRAGDRIRLEYGSKKLKKLFAEKRMDRRARRAAPVLADGSGRVLWVPGVVRADGVPESGGFEIAVGDAEES